jgi:two-component system, NtrC family, sensor histidine kinase HydH
VDIRSQSSLLAGVVSLALAVAMLLRKRAGRGRPLALFSLLCLALSCWYLADFVSAISPLEIWARIELAAGAALPLAVLTFFMEFLGINRQAARRTRDAAVGGGVLGLLVASSPLFAWAPAPQAVWVCSFGLLAVTLWLIYDRKNAAPSRLERARLLYLFTGAALVVVFSALDFLTRYGVPWPTLGSVGVTLYIFFLAQTLQRNRLLDLHELLGKVASVSALALMLGAVYGVINYWLHDRPGLFVFNTVIASFVILSLFEPLREKVEEQVLATLFRERFELIRALVGLRGRLSSVINPAQMAAMVLDTMHDIRRVTHTSFYLLAADRPGFRLLDHRGPAPIVFLEASAARGLLAAASAGERALLRETVERTLRDLQGDGPSEAVPADPDEVKRLSDIKTALEQMSAGISFPLVGEDRVLGFWNLWDELVPEAYSSDEIAAMLEVAERAAVVVENSQLFERMKERDRLAALGEMAAGLAHEIRNPLGAIKGAAQYLNPTGHPGDEGDFLRIIVEEVNRLNGVVTEFLDYARPLKSSLAPADVNDILSRTLRLLESQGLPGGVSVALRLDDQLPPALGDAEQLKQVFINLALNALQAMPAGGALNISTSLLSTSSGWRFAAVGPSGRPSEGTVEIRFRDTGEGISEEALERIFIPFYTTKEKGTGLGLAICQRIVKSHNGTLTVESRAGEGTEFVVRLPAAGPVGSADTAGLTAPRTPTPPQAWSQPRLRGRRAGGRR